MTILIQTCVHNSVNEIDTDNIHDNLPGTSISAGWEKPKYDAAGNMTAIPRPSSPTPG